MRYRGSRRMFDSTRLTDARIKLTEAFHQLRKMGFLARQNFRCCQSCASYELGEIASSMTDFKKSKYAGTVFYHHQDNTGFNECGKMYLAFGHYFDEDDASTESAGRKILDVLKENGLNVEWDGSAHTRIKVLA